MTPLVEEAVERAMKLEPVSRLLKLLGPPSEFDVRQALLAALPTDDDVERAYKDGFFEGWDVRERIDDPDEAAKHLKREWDTRAAIHTLIGRAG